LKAQQQFRKVLQQEMANVRTKVSSTTIRKTRLLFNGSEFQAKTNKVFYCCGVLEQMSQTVGTSQTVIFIVQEWMQTPLRTIKIPLISERRAQASNRTWRHATSFETFLPGSGKAQSLNTSIGHTASSRKLWKMPQKHKAQAQGVPEQETKVHFSGQWMNFRTVRTAFVPNAKETINRTPPCIG